MESLALPQPAVLDLFLAPAEEVADFVQQGGADFLPENLSVAVRVVPDVFQPEPDAGSRSLGRAFVEIPQRVGFDAGSHIVGVRAGFKKDGHGIHFLTKLAGQGGEGFMNLHLRKL